MVYLHILLWIDTPKRQPAVSFFKFPSTVWGSEVCLFVFHLFMGTHACMHATMSIFRTEDSFWNSLFHYRHPRD